MNILFYKHIFHYLVENFYHKIYLLLVINFSLVFYHAPTSSHYLVMNFYHKNVLIEHISFA